MKDFSDVMARCSLFQGIDQSNHTAMLACLGAKTTEYEKNSLIFAEGDPANQVGIVLSGAVQIVRDDFYGNRSIVASIGPSQLFGETFACAGVDHLPVSVIAAEKSTVMLIDCRRITTTCCNACEFHSRMVLNLLRVVAEKNLIFQQKITIMAKKTTRDKLMGYLMEQAKQHASREFEIPFDRQALADYLSVERSALSAEISKMRAEGILESNRSYFKLL